MNAAGGKFFGRELPEELAGLFAEAEQTAEVDVAGIVWQIAVGIIRADKDAAVGDDRRAIGLTAQRCDPLDILGLGIVPLACFAVKVARSPIAWQVSFGRDVVATWRAAPLRVVSPNYARLVEHKQSEKRPC